MTYRTSAIRNLERHSYAAFSRREQSMGMPLLKVNKLSVREFLAAVTACCILIVNLWAGYEIRSISNELTMLKRDAVQLDARYKSLKKTEGLLESPKRLGLIAKELGFHSPANSQIVRLED
ncbi:MAG: hypothetical protein M0022_09535 [Desulfobacteraceae bacterium]|nr:hypothetical protein [Desulfobacteraceae bacterium]